MVTKTDTKAKLDTLDFDDDTARLLFGKEPQDEIDWIETLLTVPSKEGQIVPFKLYPQQKLMAQNKTGRDITVKGRQTRCSSYLLARNLRRMVTDESLQCLVITQDDQTTATFRSRIKHHLRDLAQNGLPYTAALDNQDELVIEETGSRYIFASGQESTAGRAYSGSIIHISELAHWPREKAAGLLGGIEPSVPGAPFGWFDIESTPNGAEGTFYDKVKSSKVYDVGSRWNTHFYPWWMEPGYRAGIDLTCDIVYTEVEWEHLVGTFVATKDEEKLMEEYGLDVGQILWRRVRKKEQDKTDAPFLQEYPETLEGCFLTAGGSYFASPDGIDHLEKFRNTIQDPEEKLDSLPFRGGTVPFNGPNLFVWQRPQPSQSYVVWVDCAGGGLGEDSDYSAITVLNASQMFLAARVNVKISPQEIAPMAVAIASWYNSALLGGERDALGSTCLSTIQQLYYKNLWYFVQPGTQLDIKKGPSEAWGHPTQIRNLILSSLREVVFDGRLHIKDALLLQQMGAFTYQKSVGKRELLKAQAKKGYNDDLVMSLAGCCFLAPRVAHHTDSEYNTPENNPRKDDTIYVGNFGLVVKRERKGRGRMARPWLK